MTRLLTVNDLRPGRHTIAPGPWLVVGPVPVFGTDPGAILTCELTEGEARTLEASGHIAPASTEPGPPPAPPGAKRPRPTRRKGGTAR